MPRRSRPLQSTSAALCALTVVAAPLALGGTHWVSILALTGLSLAALLTAAWARRDGLRMPWILWVAWGLVAAVGFQLVPLPAGLLGAVSPTAADLHAAASEGGGPLSLSTPSTWIALALQVAFAAVLTAVVQLDRRRRRWVMDALLLSGLVVALVSALHFAFGFDKIYGIYAAQDAERMSGFFGPFVNNNTLAGFLVLTGLTGLGVAAGETADGRARFALAAAVFPLLGAMASGSRGGQVAAAVGGLLFVALAFVRGRHRGDNARERARGMAAAAALMLAACLVVALLFLPDWVAFDPTNPASDGKLAAWPGALDHAKAFWLTGSGRGGFEYVHPLFQSVEGRGTVTHPENHLLQLATELGMPVALATVAAFSLAWSAVIRRLGRRTAPALWGLLAGLGAAAAQQLFDFGLESAGLALPMAAALGLLLAGLESELHQRPPTTQGTGWGALGVGTLLLALLAWQGPAALSHHPDRDAATIAIADPWRPAATQARHRHPADGLIALAGAVQAARTGAPLTETLSWVNHALRLAPKDPRPHLLAARALVQAGRTRQAALEYRMAGAKSPWRWYPLAREISTQLTRPQDLVRAVPDTDRALWPLGNAVLAREPARARALAERWLERHPDAVDGRDLRGRACLRLKDWACVAAEGEWLVTQERLASGWMLQGALAMHRGDRAGARRALEALMGSETGERGLEAAAKLARALRDLPAAREAYDRLWRRVGTRKAAAAGVLIRKARTEEALGTPEEALRAWRAAQRHTPSAQAADGVARALARQDARAPRSSAHPALEKTRPTTDQAPRPTPVEP